MAKNPRFDTNPDCFEDLQEQIDKCNWTGFGIPFSGPTSVYEEFKENEFRVTRSEREKDKE